MDQDPETGKFLKGNQLWRKAINSFGTRGEEPMIKSEQQLLDEAAGYFNDLDINPFMEAGIYGKDAVKKELPKMRPPTIKGLCCWIGINERTWREWRERRDDLKDAIEFIQQIIWTMKFEGTASGFLHHAIIIREMGMADTQQLTGPDGGPIAVTQTWDDMETARRIAFTLSQAMKTQDEAEGSG